MLSRIIVILSITFLLNNIALADREKERCLESWFTDDYPLLTSSEGWEFVDIRQNISIYWRESMTEHHISRIYKAEMFHIEGSVDEVFEEWHTNRFSIQNLRNSFPFIQEGKILEKYSQHSDLVYEQHDTPAYLAAYYPIAHRDWLYNRCVKKIGDSYMITYRSEFDDRMPNATNYMRGWLVRSAILISPMPGPFNQHFSQISFIRQRTMMCCIPQAAHDTQQPEALVMEFSGFRSNFGKSQGPCHGDLTAWRDDLHANCHLIFDIPTSCNKVMQSLSGVIEEHQEFQSRTVWSNDYCLEAIHFSTKTIVWHLIEDIHFEVSQNSPNFCSIRAGSRTRSVSNPDFGQNYCNLYNLVDSAIDVDFKVREDNCLYKPHGEKSTLCSSEPTIFDYLCTFDFWDKVC